ncbi:twin-arginine translocase TatA/TatE family subunit [Glycomyces salinus]|uniref:twin-arginine translocase TatA/TatE family subunit n=1 Tax=Glycomyces salinus TaxID=980294 RepID=UPI0018ED998F|nr:twin-arginine translocase TatA/TatE family subunit [Glycomyces salinus]
MFGGLGGTEFLVIILIAIFLWGPDKLPEALANLRRFISKARNMASNAASDLSREIGTEIKPEDLNPKTFVRKHILTEEDQEMLTNPLKSTMKDLEDSTKPIKDDLEETTRGVDDARRTVNGQRSRQSARKAVSGSSTPKREQAEQASEQPAGRFDDVT